MKVVTFSSAKGGVGKTTLILSLACAAQRAGDRVAVLDLDPQGSALLWHRLRTRRGTSDGPEVLKGTIPSLTRTLGELEAQAVTFC